MKYLLPCECGATTPIEPTQAGQTITCRCGATLDAPTMREIRGLEPAAADSTAAGSTRRWSAGRGAAFAVGLLVFLVAGGVAGVFFWEALQIDPTPPTEERFKQLTDRHLGLEGTESAWQSAPLDTTWLIWTHLRRDLPAERPEMKYEQNRKLRRSWLNWGGLAAGIAIVGAALALMAVRRGRRTP